MQALRSLRRAPGLGVAAILCIGIGAAATTTVATLVAAILLRPVPFPAADRLVRVWFDDPGANARISFSIPDVADFAAMPSLDAFVATARVRVAARLDNGAERMRGESVSRGYFDVLDLHAAAGRLLDDGDHAADAPPALVLSHGTWMRYYGGDPGVVGRDFKTEEAVYTIVGVTPRGFDGTVEDDVVQFFIPIERYEPRVLTTLRTQRPTWVIGRLKAGTSIAAAQQDAERVRAGLAAAYPDVYRKWGVRVEPFGESWRERLRSGGAILFGAAALLLMIAAVNVGCLLLARVLDRRRELAIRSALGASRATIATQLFMEALLLVVAGGALGLLAGPRLLHAFLAIAPLGRLTLPRYLRLETDAVTLVISVGILGVAGLLAGTVPALLGGRVAPGDVLREGGRGTFGPTAATRWGAMLIGGETALTLVLLVAGALLGRSYERMSTLDIGFDRHRIARLAVTLSRSDIGVDQQALPAIYDRLQRELATVPGVSRVGIVCPTLPPWDSASATVRLDGVDLPQATDGLRVGLHRVNEGLLPMLGARIVAGRNVDAADDREHARVAVISGTLARRFGGPERALGRSLTLLDDSLGAVRGSLRVVGVTEDLAYDGLVEEDTRRFARADQGADLKASRHDLYVSLLQYPQAVVSIGAYTTGDPGAIIEPLRRKIVEIAPTSVTHWIGRMDDEIALEYEPTRFYAILVVVFSSSALLLTSVGLFALLSHTAARRTGEMGLRLALGSSRTAAAALLLRGGLMPVVAGVAGGGVAAVLLSRAMTGLLFGVGGLDVLAFAGAVAALVVVALVASLVPARRVASIDPAIALRAD